MHVRHREGSLISHLVIVPIRLIGRMLLLLYVLLKVRVVASCLGRDASGRVVDEHHLEKLEAGVVEAVAEDIVVVTLPLGEG